MRKLVIVTAILSAFNLFCLVVLTTKPAFAQLVIDRFSLSPRSAVTEFPVVSIRPTTAATVAALDVMPSGGALPHPDNGYAWMDACDADILHSNGSVPVTCARVGVKHDRVEFGSRNFDGGIPKDVYIIRDRQVLARFHSGGLDVYGKIRASSW
jgi:hypothetical protein